MSELISYETIRAVHRAEKEDQLTKLPPGFWSAVRAWIARKAEGRDTSSLLEVNNAKRLLEDIINRRERKIVMAALRTTRGEVPPGTLDETERALFDRTVKMLNEWRAIATEQLFTAETVEEKMTVARNSIAELRSEPMVPRAEVKIEPAPLVETKPPAQFAVANGPRVTVPDGQLFVKVLSDLPRFVDGDMTAYGPLKTGDMITLPTALASTLISRGAAVNALE